MNKAIHLVLAVCIIYFSVSYAQQDPDSQQFKQITDGEFKHIHLHRFPDSKQLITSLMKEQVLIGFGIIQNEIGEVNRVQIGDGFSGDFYTSISPDGKWGSMPEKGVRVSISGEWAFMEDLRNKLRKMADRCQSF